MGFAVRCRQNSAGAFLHLLPGENDLTGLDQMSHMGEKNPPEAEYLNSETRPSLGGAMF